jgi:hypothetical protein
LIVAMCHVAIVSSLGAKLLLDRARYPRVWARAAPVDPSLPIRGRYVRLRVEAEPAEGVRSIEGPIVPVALSVKDGRLAATSVRDSTKLSVQLAPRDGAMVAVLQQPLAYFIPEHIPDPSIRQRGEELWVEVTIPRAGAPRPIRLGVKKDGVLTPLD